jgi:murein DD-endopeptidase MepM/ murein hydrolase activator NlpD
VAGVLSLAAVCVGWSLSAAEVSSRYPNGGIDLTSVNLNGSGDAGSGSRTPTPNDANENIYDETAVAQGAMQGSLFDSAEAAGAAPLVTAQVVSLLSHKLDFSRDIHPGDKLRMVYDRQVTGAGRTIDTGDLLYAEIGAPGRITRFYRFEAPGAAPEYFDAEGRSVDGLLLRTPVDGARVTSGFGMRLHPLLGYTRMHQGVDFGVPVGTPVYAAGDGVVEEADWKGGYGRWMKLRHPDGWETGYAHLSGWAVHAGQRVRQGQVIAFTGSTGESTGPHLHYEVIRDGQRIDPKGADAASGRVLAGVDLIAFKAEKARIDALLTGASRSRLALADTTAAGVHLRPSETLSR